MNDHERFLQLIAGRELGGLDAAESAELDEHLAGCAACSLEVRRMADATAEMALAAPVRQPPAGMRSSILAAIHAEAAAPAPIAAAAAPADPSPARRSGTALRDGPSAGWLARLRGSGLGLAAAGLAAILVIVSLGLGARALDLQSQLDAQNRAAATAQQRLAALAGAIVVALDPGHASANLEPEAGAPSAIAQVVFRPGTDQAYLIADRLPPTPAGHVYQLWYADATGVHPLSTFAYDGNGAFIEPFGVDLGGKTAAMVTLETAGGSTGQPGPQVVFGQLPPG